MSRRIKQSTCILVFLVLNLFSDSLWQSSDVFQQQTQNHTIVIREFIATNIEAPKIKVDNNLYSEGLGFKS